MQASGGMTVPVALSCTPRYTSDGRGSDWWSRAVRSANCAKRIRRFGKRMRNCSARSSNCCTRRKWLHSAAWSRASLMSSTIRSASCSATSWRSRSTSGAWTDISRSCSACRCRSRHRRCSTARHRAADGRPAVVDRRDDRRRGAHPRRRRGLAAVLGPWRRCTAARRPRADRRALRTLGHEGGDRPIQSHHGTARVAADRRQCRPIAASCDESRAKRRRCGRRRANRRVS